LAKSGSQMICFK